ncbi:hypothetical protein CN681_18610 [Bacillus toyonensis]|uniref:hypothetical protein n=1 Tax=Bacillus toyonensis TaxID=155322 RepID=UPI000BEF23AF|nr:hypothetical protein [Bacillus toyonensis]PEK07808.1 hypothetical protein CN681_18610 [Bacillus toyonensis]PGA59134.1 hypothetical protein COL86_00295 [Bacillus toyonensis]
MENNKTYNVKFYFSDEDDHSVYMVAESAESLSNDLASMITTSKAILYSVIGEYYGENGLEKTVTLMTNKILRVSVERLSGEAMDVISIENLICYR